MDPAWHRLAGGVVEHLDVDPVATGVDELDPDPVAGRLAVAFDVAPPHVAELIGTLPHDDGGGGYGGDLGVREPRVRRVGGAPARPVVLGPERLRVGGDTAVDLEREDAGLLRVGACRRGLGVGVGRRGRGVGADEPDRPCRRTDEGLLVEVPQGDAGDGERWASRNERYAFDGLVGMGVVPAPEVVSGCRTSVVLGQAVAGGVPVAAEALLVAVMGVGDREERLTSPIRRHDLDLEPLPDRDRDGLAAREVEGIVGDRRADTVAGWTGGLQQPVRNDHPLCLAADLDRHR
jgi:hypothetical protein